MRKIVRKWPYMENLGRWSAGVRLYEYGKRGNSRDFSATL